MPLKETMGISHRENACETCVAVIHLHPRERFAPQMLLPQATRVDRVVAGMNCERESGMKGSACSL